jgi:hypothetical protein
MPIFRNIGKRIRLKRRSSKGKNRSDIMELSKTIIEELIDLGEERNFLEYKAIPYYEKQSAEFIRDINALANSRHSGPKLIIIGVADDGHNSFVPIGISKEHKFDNFSHFEELIQTSIEPKVSIEFRKVIHHEKIFIAIIVLSDYSFGPYIISKKIVQTKYNGKGEPVHHNLQNQMFIRRGTITSKLTPKELKEAVKTEGILEVQLLDSLFFVNNEGIGDLQVKIINGLNITKAYVSVGLSIQHDGKKIYERTAYWFETYDSGSPRKDFLAPDFYFTINSKTETIGSLWFSFSSTDAIVCGLDEYGNSSKKFDFVLRFLSAPSDIPTEFVFHNCSIFANEKVLWKILLKKDKDK